MPNPDPTLDIGYNGDDSAPSEKEIFMGEKRLLICHGHTYQVKLGIGMLTNEARGRGADAVRAKPTPRLSNAMASFPFRSIMLVKSYFILSQPFLSYIFEETVENYDSDSF